METPILLPCFSTVANGRRRSPRSALGRLFAYNVRLSGAESGPLRLTAGLRTLPYKNNRPQADTPLRRDSVFDAKHSVYASAAFSIIRRVTARPDCR